MVSNLHQAVELLIQYWRRQGIQPVSDLMVSSFSKESKSIYKIDDFKHLYSKANGMKNEYPNYGDGNGFLFYPVESILLYDEKYVKGNKLLVFADCLHGCWAYAVRAIDTSIYEIVLIMPDHSFHKICSSLTDFIYLYINDSKILYK